MTSLISFKKLLDATWIFRTASINGWVQPARRGCRLSKGAEAHLSADSDSSQPVRSTADITGDVTGYARDCDAVCRCSVETVWLCQALGVECPSAYTDLLSPISADVPSPLLSLLNMKRFEIQAIVGKIPRLLCQLRLLYKDFRPSRGHWNISMVWMSDWVCTWRPVRTLFTLNESLNEIIWMIEVV